MNLKDLLLNIIDAERYRRSLRRALRRDAEAFNKRMYDKIEDRDYPIHGGIVTNPPTKDRRDPIRGDITPTERLHGTTLREGAMPPRFEKHRNQLTILFRNQAPHAEYFFEPTGQHPITGKGGKNLHFWAGHPLPWGGAGEHIVTKEVWHPGTEGFSKYMLKEFNLSFRTRFIKKASESIDRIFFGSL